jgi:hypothetical protein
MMTTATTIDFDQPTLFKEGRFVREDAPPAEAAQQPPARSAAAPAAGPAQQPTARSAAAPPAGPAHRRGVTLDDVLAAAWDALAAHHSVTCPVCRGSMAPRYGSGAQPVGGRCRRCGSTLG